MRLAERPKVLTVDMTRLAGGAGDSDTINTGDVLEVKIAAGLSEKDQIDDGGSRVRRRHDRPPGNWIRECGRDRTVRSGIIDPHGSNLRSSCMLTTLP